MYKYFLIGFIVTGLSVGCQPKDHSEQLSQIESQNQQKIEEDTVKETTYDVYGLPVDSLSVQEHRVKRNESFYLILDKYDFTPRQIYDATRQAKSIADIRDIKPGQKYRTYTSVDSTRQVRRVVWQPNPVDYVVFDWKSDSLDIFRATRPIKTRTEVIAGTIENSLYEAISEEGGSPLLAHKLADVFAWQIDFFGLREGDRFRVLYNKKFVDDDFYSTGQILAAEFEHRGKVYKAYHFQQGDLSGYFTESGESVEKALLKAPFKFNQRISSRFNRNRFHPILKRRRPHYGTDYAAPYGTPVLSVGDGTVTRARYGRGEGNMVKIRHNSVYETAYMHLSKYASGIHEGVRVEQGQVIGYVGSTGMSTGPHLHYSLYKNGHPVNSLKVELPASDSVPDSLMDAFAEERDRLNRKLYQVAERPITYNKMALPAK